MLVSRVLTVCHAIWPQALFAICHDPAELAELAKLTGQIIAVDVTAAGSVEWHVQDAAGAHALHMCPVAAACAELLYVGPNGTDSIPITPTHASSPPPSPPLPLSPRHLLLVLGQG